MGRRAGVSSDETREQLLAAAMEVVVARGYDGTRVAEIARVAGVTTGAIYNHFDSKADLLTSAIQDHGPGAFTELVDATPGASVIDLFRELGANLPERADQIGPALMEIIVATRRDEDVAKALTVSVSHSEQQRRDLISRGQGAGVVDGDLDAQALSRLTTMIAFGSMVASALDLEPIDSNDWGAVLDRLLRAVQPDAAGPAELTDPGRTTADTIEPTLTTEPTPTIEATQGDPS